MTLFLGYGKEIVNAPDASAVFGAAPPPMPTGASAVPVAGPTNFGQFAQPTPEMQQPAQVPQWGGQANPNVLPPQFQPPQPVAPFAGQQQVPGLPTMGQPTVSNAYPSNQAPPPAWGATIQPAIPPVGVQPVTTPRPPWQQ